MFGTLGPVSALTLGGGGTGGVWGATTREEAVETVRAAVDGGITFLDVAPGYGNGEAERVVGEAYGGRLPEGVRISTKHHLGNVPAGAVAGALREALAASLDRLRMERVDLFFLHGMVVPDGFEGRGTPRSLFVEAVRPAFEAMVADGTIGAWGVSGVGVPSALLETLGEDPAPAAIQCVANLLDSPGGMRAYDEEPRPRDLIAAATARGAGVMGIRAVQAGALTDAIDRDLPGEHPEVVDFERVARLAGAPLLALDGGGRDGDPGGEEPRGAGGVPGGGSEGAAGRGADGAHRRVGRRGLAAWSTTSSSSGRALRAR